MDDAEIERQIDAHIDKLAAQYSSTSLANDAQDHESDGPRPELPPAMVIARSRTTDEILADLNKSPLFMTDLEENNDIAALQALAYDGTPRENAEGFKDRGNECFRVRGYKDACEFYTKGIAVLAAEEAKRRHTQTPPEGDQAPGDRGAEEVKQERSVLGATYLNRAACHLEMRNYRSCWLDCAAAIRLDAGNVKAYYRSARALLAVDRIPEADDACTRGLALDASNSALQQLAAQISSRAAFLAEKASKEAQRAAVRERRAELLQTALTARGIVTRTTADPPEMEDARVRLSPDEDDPASELVVPTVLLYPLRMESDFIRAFGETQTLEEHLGYILPPPWDEEGKYGGASGVVCYVETREGGLVKMGKRVALLKVLSGGRVEIVDGVMKVFVLPVGEAEAWAKEFKEKRAAERSKA